MRITGFVLTVAPPAHLLLLDHRSMGVPSFVRLSDRDRSVLFCQFREVSLTPAAAAAAAATTTRVRKANLT